jgi:hypothetical protein
MATESEYIKIFRSRYLMDSWDETDEFYRSCAKQMALKKGSDEDIALAKRYDQMKRFKTKPYTEKKRLLPKALKRLFDIDY